MSAVTGGAAVLLLPAAVVAVVGSWLLCVLGATAGYSEPSMMGSYTSTRSM